MLRKLLYLNGLAAISVVLNHAIYRVLPGMIATLTANMGGEASLVDRLSRPSFQAIQILDEIAVFAVPIFLFVSGWSLFISTRPGSKTIGWETILNRVKFLALPFLFWTLIFIIWFVAGGKQYSGWELVNIFLFKGIFAPFYYIPMLITLLLLSPLLVPLARDLWKVLLAVAVIFHLSVTLFLFLVQIVDFGSPFIQALTFVLDIWKTPVNIFWFILGLVVGFHQAEFKLLLNRINRYYLWVAFFLVLILYTAEILYLTSAAGEIWLDPQLTFSYQFYCCFLLVIFMMLENFRFPFSTLVGKIGGMSFCIYLLHYPIQLILDGFFINYAPVPLKHPFSVTFGLSLAGLFIPIALYLLINRSPLHRYSRYIVG